MDRIAPSCALPSLSIPLRPFQRRVPSPREPADSRLISGAGVNHGRGQKVEPAHEPDSGEQLLVRDPGQLEPRLDGRAPRDRPDQRGQPDPGQAEFRALPPKHAHVDIGEELQHRHHAKFRVPGGRGGDHPGEREDRPVERVLVRQSRAHGET